MFDYDADVANAIKELDKYDFTRDLIVCWNWDFRDPYSIMNYIQQEYPELYDDIEVLSVDEFIIYLAERYDITFIEETSYRMLKPRFTNR